MLLDLYPGSILCLALLTAIAVLLVLALRPRRSVAGCALVALRGVARAPRLRGFRLETQAGELPVLLDGALLLSGEPRDGDRVQVLGVWKQVPRAESLYRELGCERALDAAYVLRARRLRPVLRGLALAAALGGAALLAVAGLLHLGAELTLPIPVEVLEPSRALLRPLACPDGAEPRDAPVREPEAAGWTRYCALPGGIPHGPLLQLDLLGRVRAQGAMHRGRRHGRWITRSPRAPFLVIAEYDRGELHGSFREEGFGYQVRGAYRHGREHGRWDRRDRRGFTSRGYDEGVPEGFWIEPGAQGSYRRGERHGRWRLHEAGHLAVGDYRAGRRVGRWTFHRLEAGRTGVAVAEGSYRDGLREGLWRERDAHGALVEQRYRGGRVVREPSSRALASLRVNARLLLAQPLAGLAGRLGPQLPSVDLDAHR